MHCIAAQRAWHRHCCSTFDKLNLELECDARLMKSLALYPFREITTGALSLRDSTFAVEMFASQAGWIAMMDYDKPASAVVA
jgi:hypothetical protein